MKQIKAFFLYRSKIISILAIIFFISAASIHAQPSVYDFQKEKVTYNGEEINIKWNAPDKTYGFEDEEIQFLNFEGALLNPDMYWLPTFSKKIKIGDNTVNFNVELKNSQWEKLTPEEASIIKDVPEKYIGSDLNITPYVSRVRKKAFASIAFVPIKKSASGGFEKLVSFTIEIKDITEDPAAKRGKRSFKVRSVLASGEWFKIGLARDGIYKVDYQMLQESGMNMNNLRSQQIRLFGNGGGMLPFDNSEPRIDDLAENRIEIHDGGDGSFDPGDYFIFYGQSQTRWKLYGNTYKHEPHLFTDTTYYFITRDYNVGSPKRVEPKQSAGSGADVVLTEFDDHQFHEENSTNIIKSGRRWYGESFSVRRNYTFSFDFPNLITSEPVRIEVAAAARAIRQSGSYTISANNTELPNKITTGTVSPGYANRYAFHSRAVNNYNSGSSRIDVTVNYDNTSSSDVGWLDYIRVTGKRQLRASSSGLTFRNRATLSAQTAEFRMQKFPSSGRIWDVTDPTNCREQEGTVSGNTFTFRTEGGKLNQYIFFREGEYRTPQRFGKVGNQNLHSLPQTDYLIVSHPRFMAAAERLADFHRKRGEFSVQAVNINHVYNEFSSGAQDITAIKDFMKMFYDRAGMNENDMPRYLLLFGGASYDYKDRISGNTNFIPIYQSLNSETPTGSYMSDDYVGFLDDDESDRQTDYIDIGIGRIPVNTSSQAQNVVDKIIRYHNIPRAFGAWRNRLTWVGDDGDRRIHMSQADSLARKIEERYPSYNHKKIYFDRFKKESTSGGQRYPEVQNEINDAMKRGTLLMTYTGHGGVNGWAHERVLTLQDVNSWTNRDQMPVFLTATCEYTRFDDPERTSAGEITFTNPDGGASALLTTTRLVYSRPNFELADIFTDHVFEAIDGETPTLGDLMMLSKDVSLSTLESSGINFRNFSLLGDPAMRIAYPQLTVETTQAPDTISALEKVTIKGRVVNDYGQLQKDYNGIVYPVVYDQAEEITTLDNNNEGPFIFEERSGIIFNGKASVKNGEFEFSFVVPKDVSFDFDSAKVSYYTDDKKIDGNGYDRSIVIGGVDENAEEDNTPPDVQLWMNDNTFVSGGITDENPNLYAEVFDESGINTVGSGIGHDITAILDENTANPIILNDYYESDLDSYQSGTITYPFSDLEEGRHTLSLKVWDVYNNSGEGYTEFVVASDAELAIEHVLNYPNPFTTRTAFYFEHNAPGQSLEVRVQVFTVGGKLVKTIDGIHATDGFRVGPIYWNGRDDFGDAIGKGVYVYKVQVTAPSGESVDKFEKLVILN